MNTRSIVERNDDVLLSASSFSKEQDLVDPSPRLSILGESSPLTIPAKADTEKLGEEKKKRRKKRKKKWTKPEGKPKRPLSAYNIFFAKERILMLGKDVPTAEQEALKKKVHCKTHGKISFAVMARTIGAKWKSLGANERKTYEDKAREEKARYLIELTSWKEAQKNGVSAGLDLGTMIDDNMAKPGMMAMASQASSMPELRMNSSALENVIPLSQGNGGQNSNLVRLMLEEENRNRYLSLLRLQNQANQNRFSQMDQATFPLSGVPRRASAPVDSMAGSQQLPRFNADTLLNDNRALLRNMQGPQNPPMEYNSRYHQALEEYATMLQLEDQQSRMIGSFKGRNNGL
mmetsp:Transcript_14328/g.35984  ORF Transcript_14328/g.35984 Transcript_14328/m.35984 type:complete len:347 (-) Transcript_14328:83-1123(-)|eukprot:CAMPEP_0116081284 /NCGR_PEP_ID=MMETSP0327-20121206/2117_1 /TAXON_ID=44447 /ORGANISM="Pseudo-nitzschia delicatissima, Strain B596" /LENGTH=346 /DNA_ID=CAMNT_0003572013 /DNA_START=74 /DNA_END=1114 /DNA_ORIENTATION=+